MGPRPAAEDIIIIGGGAKATKIALSISEQNNPLPENQVKSALTLCLHVVIFDGLKAVGYTFNNDLKFLYNGESGLKGAIAF